jgi:hypothetical protein
MKAKFWGKYPQKSVRSFVHNILMFRSLERLKYFCIPSVFDEGNIWTGLGGGGGHGVIIQL